MTTLFDQFCESDTRFPTADKSRVLIAEDYVDLGAVIAMLLRRCGFEVRLAHNGKDVLSIALDFVPHYIILDIHLPGLGGYEAAELLRKVEGLKKTIIIGISAFRPAGGTVLENFDHFLIKPFDLDALLAFFRPR